MTFSVSSVNIQAKTPHKIFPEKVAGCTLEFYLLVFYLFYHYFAPYLGSLNLQGVYAHNVSYS